MDYNTTSLNHITELTRRDIIDHIIAANINWSGRLNEPDFLARIFDLKSMQSFDGRFENAYGDIWQHRINNYDWDDYWVFSDARFNLIYCSDDIFLRFLCEMIHPVVRPDTDEAISISQEMNQYLKIDGFQLVERIKLSGKPVFSANLINDTKFQPALSIAKKSLEEIDESYVSQQITRMESALIDDPYLAIGTAKELVETVCKTIIINAGENFDKKSDLQKLVKDASAILKLLPEDIPNEAKASRNIKSILGSLSTIVHCTAELRNEYGTGHGKEAGAKGLTSRHAKLVVGAASTLALFLWETHRHHGSRLTSIQAQTS